MEDLIRKRSEDAVACAVAYDRMLRDIESKIQNGETVHPIKSNGVPMFLGYSTVKIIESIPEPFKSDCMRSMKESVSPEVYLHFAADVYGTCQNQATPEAPRAAI